MAERLTSFVNIAFKVKDTNKLVEGVTDKILKWKKGFGDLDQQEKMIRAKFTNEAE